MEQLLYWFSSHGLLTYLIVLLGLIVYLWSGWGRVSFIDEPNPDSSTITLMAILAAAIGLSTSPPLWLVIILSVFGSVVVSILLGEMRLPDKVGLLIEYPVIFAVVFAGTFFLQGYFRLGLGLMFGSIFLLTVMYECKKVYFSRTRQTGGV